MRKHEPGRSAQNRLLAALPMDVYERLQPNLELVPLALGKVVYEAHQSLSHVYFPTTAIVSLLYTMENGSSAEMGIVGCDGVVGIAVFMGGDTTPNRAVVQSAGDAFRLDLTPFRREFRRSGELHRLLLLYTQALLTQMSQIAVCNRLHSEVVNKPTARPASRVGRCSLLAYLPDMSRRCAPSALLSGCSLRFFHSLSVFISCTVADLTRLQENVSKQDHSSGRYTRGIDGKTCAFLDRAGRLQENVG
jgi:hypothetical protein